MCSSNNAAIVRKSVAGSLPSIVPVPVYAQYATSDCAKPELRSPDKIALTLSTDPREETADAIKPSTPHDPPESHSRDPGGFEIAFAITPPTG